MQMQTTGRACLLALLAAALIAPLVSDVSEARAQDKRPYRVDQRRDYQQRSVGTVQGRARRAAGWVKNKLNSIHVTPARLCIALGLLGLLWSWGKNKRHARWAVTFGIALLLLGFGVAAIVFKWPAFN
jgi:hypothetical protein